MKWNLKYMNQNIVIYPIFYVRQRLFNLWSTTFNLWAARTVLFLIHLNVFILFLDKISWIINMIFFSTQNRNSNLKIDSTFYMSWTIFNIIVLFYFIFNYQLFLISIPMKHVDFQIMRRENKKKKYTLLIS